MCAHGKKFWTTNKEHNIGLCSLLVGLMGPLDFTLLKHSTTQTHSKVQKPDLSNNANTNKTLSDKLAGIIDPDEISKVISEHANMSRPPTLL